MLVKRSSSDDALAMHVGTRPRPAAAALPARCWNRPRPPSAAGSPPENPTAAAAVEGVLTEVVGGIRSETRKISSQYATAAAEVEKLKQDGHLGEAEVYKFARENRFEEATVALSMLCGVELDAVERALQDRGHEIALILAKLAGFSSTTAKAILLLKTADRGISAQDLDNALRTYEKLQLETARRVLGFYRTRIEKPRQRRRSPRPASRKSATWRISHLGRGSGRSTYHGRLSEHWLLTPDAPAMHCSSGDRRNRASRRTD